MVPLDRALVNSYRLSVVTMHVVICSGLAAICNAKLPLASIIHVRGDNFFCLINEAVY